MVDWTIDHVNILPSIMYLLNALGATSNRTVGRGWVKEGGKGGKEEGQEIISHLDSHLFP